MVYWLNQREPLAYHTEADGRVSWWSHVVLPQPNKRPLTRVIASWLADTAQSEKTHQQAP